MMLYQTGLVLSNVKTRNYITQIHVGTGLIEGSQHDLNSNLQMYLHVCVWVTAIFLFASSSSSFTNFTDIHNDSWILHNMFGMIDDLRDNYDNNSWFSSESPCQNWIFVTCNNDSRVIALEGFKGVGNKNYTINTTFWPPNLLNLTFISAGFSGVVTLSNIPKTIQKIKIKNCENLAFARDNCDYSYNCNHITSPMFPDLSQLSNLIHFELINFNLTGTITNLRDKIPNNLKELHLETTKEFTNNWNLQKFPTFNNVSLLTTVTIRCEIVEKESFVDILLPPKLESLYAEKNNLNGTIDFRKIRRNSPNLNVIYLDDNHFTNVNYFGLNDDTIVRLEKDNSCDLDAYFANKQKVGNPDNFTLNELILAICAERSSPKCKGTQNCFETCVCFKIPPDWSPALNDFYTITATLVLLFVIITSIAFSPSIKWYQFIYLKIVSVQLGLLLLQWILGTLILGGDNFSDTITDEEIYWISNRLVYSFWLIVVFPCTISTWVCHDYSNYHFLKKFNFVKKVVIDKKYHHLLNYRSNTLNGSRYFLIAADDNNSNTDNTNGVISNNYVYWKITTNNIFCLKLFGNRWHDISISQLTVYSIVYTIYCWRVLHWIVTSDLIDSTGGNTGAYFVYIPAYDLVLLSITMLIACLHGIKTSNFARYQILIIVFILAPLYYSIVQFRETWLAFLFRTNLYSGVIDELNIGRQAPVLLFGKTLGVLLFIWILCIFCLTSLILYIKMSNKIKMTNYFVYQINLTISSVFSGLLDYLTDVLLILYWINSTLYVYAFMELLFVIFGQLATSYLIKNVPWYCNCSKANLTLSESHDHSKTRRHANKNKNKNTIKDGAINIVKHFCFLLGFRVIYQSIKPWDNDVVKYEYKWCKLWELMFESMPSVMLSTYVTLMQTTNSNINNEANTISVSVIVSMTFSFINLTNTIVAVLNQDQIQPTVNSNLSAMPDVELATILSVSVTQSPGAQAPFPNVFTFTDDETKETKEIKENKENVEKKDENDNHNGNSGLYSNMARSPQSPISPASLTRSTRSETQMLDAPHTTPKRNGTPTSLPLPNKLWITDKQTGEVFFCAEKKNVNTNQKKLSTFQQCTKYYNQCCLFLWHFDVKIANFVIWLFLTTDLFLKTLSVLSIVVFIDYLFVNESNNDTINWDLKSVTTSVETDNKEYLITQSLFATAINLLYLVFLVLLEYVMFDFVLKNDFQSLQQGNLNSIRKHILQKYFCVGLFSNSFYFLLTIGVKYVPKLIHCQSFLKMQYCRVGICCFVVFVQILLNLLFYFGGNFNVWVFSVVFYLAFLFLLVLHCASLLYVKKYVLLY